MRGAIHPDRSDLSLIGSYLGKVTLGLGVLQLLPLVVATGLGEWNSATAYAIGAGLAISLWAASDRFLTVRRSLDWSHAMVVVALSWLVGAVIVAVPMVLSGRFSTPVHAVFEAMSGLTTTGMSVIHDLDHTPVSDDLFRHLLQISGGLGIVIVVLAVFSGGGGGITSLYASEARDERVLPNVIRTSRFIFRVTLTWFVSATLALVGALLLGGFSTTRALYHAVNLFFASFSTGGFSTMQSSMSYYHSATVELVVAIIMLAGTLSFGLHLAAWRGERGVLWGHLEARTLAVTTTGLFVVVTVGLLTTGTYGSVSPLLRKGLFTLVSAVSSTGHQVNAGDTYLHDWGALAPAAIVVAMAIGGMASSTAGGIKAVRIGLVVLSVRQEIRRLLLPESAVVMTSYQLGRRTILRDETVRAATTVLLLFLASFLLAAAVGMGTDGLDLYQALFESVSVGANIGISIGVVSPDTSTTLLLVYLLQMWLGRLEFIAVVVLLGYVTAVLLGRSGRSA